MHTKTLITAIAAALPIACAWCGAAHADELEKTLSASAMPRSVSTFNPAS